MENKFEKLNCEAVELECVEFNSTFSAMFYAQTAWTGLVIKATSFVQLFRSLSIISTSQVCGNKMRTLKEFKRTFEL